jgi:hypothetical protein
MSTPWVEWSQSPSFGPKGGLQPNKGANNAERRKTQGAVNPSLRPEVCRTAQGTNTAKRPTKSIVKGLR